MTETHTDETLFKVRATIVHELGYSTPLGPAESTCVADDIIRELLNNGILFRERD